MIFKLVCERSTPEQCAEWLRAPLEHAAGTANHDLVKKMLKAGADGSAGWKGCHGKTLLHAAPEGGDGQVVAALIRAGAGGDKNARIPGTGRTPLHLAILNRKGAAAGALIMARTDANILDSHGDAPLHLHFEGGHTRSLRTLLIRGADHAVKGSKGQYPFHFAAGRGLDEIVRSLVQRGANLDILDGQSVPKTPLALALVEEGADANIQMGHYSKTALHVTVQFNKAASIPALIEAGANMEAKNITGLTPLHYAACFGSCATMLALLQRGANVNSKTKGGGWTPLHYACHEANADATHLLLRWSADETIVDNVDKAPSQMIPDIAGASEQRRPTLERLTKLLAHAPQDRAWRRGGFVVMCRAHPDRLRLVVEIPDNEAEAIGQQPRERPSRRARRGQVKVEVGVGDAHGRGAGSDNVRRSGRRAGVEGAGGGFDGVADLLMVTDENVFRNIVGFL